MGDLLPSILRERLTQGQCVAFVGAGFSMACGMPSWNALLQRLLERAVGSHDPNSNEAELVRTCSDAIKSGRFDVAGSMLRDLLLPSDFDDVIQQEFGIRRLATAKKDERDAQFQRLRYLAQGPWAGIVTTNYDALVETALAEKVISIQQAEITDERNGFGDREIAIVQGDDPRIGTILARPPAGGFFVKVHGSVSGTGVVLSSEDYGRTYLATPKMTSFLTALMLRYHVVFVGCSLEDEIVRLRRKLAMEFAGVIPAAYALLPATDANRQRMNWLRESAKIECIAYPASDHRHQAVERFLEEAAKCSDWALRRGPRPAISRKLADLNLITRVQAAGEINQRILRLIARQPNATLDHGDLVELERLSPIKADASLYRLSAEERVYRVLFLVSIQLVTEELDSVGSPRYKVAPDVRNAIEAASNRSSGSLGQKKTRRSAGKKVK